MGKRSRGHEMVGAVYIEEQAAAHPRAQAILKRFPRVPHISCERYGEVFNRRGQSFRLQKKRPSLILALKHDGHVLEAPAGYGIGGERNFYFSHLLNCPFDCRYCFLQGMYRSAHYVLFVNYEDFFGAIEQETQSSTEDSWFFSGYDCDSLAFEGISSFAADALPVFRQLDRAWLELRTKSLQVKPLLESEPFERCVVAFSFTPEEVSRVVEHRVPSVARRIEAMAKLAAKGWRLGLRFDPLIYSNDFVERYRNLFASIFAQVPVSAIHSVSLGAFRLPKGFFKSLEKMYPDDRLIAAGPYEDQSGMVSYRRDLEQAMIGDCTELLLQHIPSEVFFPCSLPTEVAV